MTWAEWQEAGTYQWTVPAGVTSITIAAAGATAQSSPTTPAAERRTRTVAVSSGQQLTIVVGTAWGTLAASDTTVTRASTTLVRAAGRGRPAGTGGTATPWTGSVDGHASISWTTPSVPPAAPALEAPAAAAQLLRIDTHRFRWNHTDPHGRPQIGWELQHRPSGGTATTLSGLSAAQYVDIPGGQLPASAGQWRVRTGNTIGWGPWSGWRTFTGVDRPPAVPELDAPDDGVTINRSQPRRFSWGYSSPDGRPQSGAQLQHRPAGTTTATTVDVTGTVQHVDLPGGTFGAGDHEWRVRTRDSLGTYGGWSGWRTLTAVEPPGELSIVAPADGSTIAANPTEVAWSTPVQDAYQIMVGYLDPTTAAWLTMYGSGTVEEPETRTHPIPVTGVVDDVSIELRVRRSSIWSPWASVTVDMNPTVPETPSVLVDDTTTDGAVVVGAHHPNPEGDVPTVVEHHIWRRRRLPAELGGGWETAERIAAGIAPASSHVDWTVRSGHVYSWQVVAVADTGAEAASDWTET